MRVYIYVFAFLFVIGLFFLIKYLVDKEQKFRSRMTEGMSDYNKLQFMSNRRKKTTLTVLLIVIPLAFLLVVGFGIVINIGIK